MGSEPLRKTAEGIRTPAQDGRSSSRREGLQQQKGMFAAAEGEVCSSGREGLQQQKGRSAAAEGKVCSSRREGLQQHKGRSDQVGPPSARIWLGWLR